MELILNLIKIAFFSYGVYCAFGIAIGMTKKWKKMIKDGEAE